MRLAPLLLAGALTACIPPRPLSITGALPPPQTTYAMVEGSLLAPAVQEILERGLMARGLSPATTAYPPERLISISFADRPHISGTFVSDTRPASRAAPEWLDRPRKGGWFAKGRREVRLSIRFLGSDGRVREQRTAVEVITRNAPDADIVRLLQRALAR